MKIDWFTLIAQVVNFIVLMWLLKRYLYKPILNAIDERENKILSQLKDAEAKKAEASKERDDFEQKNREFDTQKEEMMQKLVSEINSERIKLMAEARRKADALKVKLEEALTEEQEHRRQEISKKAVEEVFAITRKTLADISSASLEEQAVRTFLERMETLPGEEKAQFFSTLKSRTGPIRVQSAFKLSTKQQKDIKKSVSGVLGKVPQLEFSIKPELIGGIELITNGYKLSWSISDYLDSLKKSIDEHHIEDVKVTATKQDK